MKLSEIAGYKNNPHYQAANTIFKNPPEDAGPLAKYTGEYQRSDQLAIWEKHMTDNGFHHLGTGNYGSVYEKEGYPWVFKIMKDDPGFMYYMKYSKENQNNPNVPRVRGDFIKINETTFVIRIEKLSPMSNTFFNNEFNNIVPIMRMFSKREMEDLDQDYQEILSRFKDKFPGVFKIIYDMAKTHYLLDISSRNMMMRGDVPVITDPVFE